MTDNPAIVWFRRDLRLADNPALDHARRYHSAVVPVYIHDVQADGAWPPGAASRWWLHHSLEALGSRLADRGSRLLVLAGDTREALERLVDDTGARGVYWNRVYEPALVERDRRLKAWLDGRDDLEVRSFRGNVLFEPWELTRDGDRPYRVFTPYWNRMQKEWRPIGTCPEPRALPGPAHWPEAGTADGLGLLPDEVWDQGLKATWSPGEVGARRRLKDFLVTGVRDYPSQRDVPSAPGTSRLSAHLHFGEASPARICLAMDDSGSLPAASGPLAHVRELAWREFSILLLFHFPAMVDEPLQERFRRFPWRDDYASDLKAWQQGCTGIPMVDAGMRQLWQTGWMHNRVRMLVASFLTKNLLVPWQEGARWFFDTLVDADLANNSQGWQWCAGSGVDAAPFFRIFNPVTQGERFDPEGAYVRRWVPELKGIPGKAIHAPWAVGQARLARAGVRLGRDYPEPRVDLQQSRRRALETWDRIR